YLSTRNKKQLENVFWKRLVPRPVEADKTRASSPQVRLESRLKATLISPKSFNNKDQVHLLPPHPLFNVLGLSGGHGPNIYRTQGTRPKAEKERSRGKIRKKGSEKDLPRKRVSDIQY
ncbi:hypothetical protein SK128_002057, partial [Halocaridina rubra]